MSTNWIALLITWAAVAIVVVTLAVYRRMVASHEDDTLHVRDSDAAIVAEQGAIARKLEVIDRWGKILTVVALIYGLILAGFYIHASWVEKNASSTNLQILR